MTSKEDDDTLPLPGLSEELVVDVTADEDFIPTSQPYSNVCSKVSRKSESSPDKIAEEKKDLCTVTDTQLTFPARITTLSSNNIINQSFDKDKSSDFIPETETKKRKIEYFKEEAICRKKLHVDDSLTKCTEDIFESQSNLDWVTEESNVPVLGHNFSIINESSPNIDSLNYTNNNDNISLFTAIESEKKFREPVTEILVNDSSETVDLDGSENLTLSKLKKLEMKTKMSLEKIDVSCESNSDVDRCEETQLLHNSSVLLLDQWEPTSLKYENCKNNSTSQKFYLQQTIEDNDSAYGYQNKHSLLESECSSPVMAKLSKELNLGDPLTEVVDVLQQNENVKIKKEVKKHLTNSTPSCSLETFSPSSYETKKMEFKLAVSCKVTMNIKTKEIVQKFILNVNELPKYKPKPIYGNNSDNTTDKSKRYSTSSSGSVYSDKTGLPFALPKRVSAISDQTDASDSSEEGFSKRLREGKKAFERMPWSNEYLLPLKIDELMKVSIENQEFLSRIIDKPSPKKFRNLNCNGVNHLKEILESSSSEQTSINGLDGLVTDANAINTLKNQMNDKEDLKMKPLEKSPNKSKEENELNEVKLQQKTECEENKENNILDLLQLKTTDLPAAVQLIPTNETIEQITKNFLVKNPEKEKISNISKQKNFESWDSEEIRYNDKDNNVCKLEDSLPVFARWTDKQYYSGVICGIAKNDWWNIKFDDGTMKMIREHFIMPAKWLKVGELVFALVDEKYVSGQIINIKPGEEAEYTVELDNLKEEVTVKISDLCLTEVMAGIVREKYKPFSATPKGKDSSYIDFDNVLTGKRHREQRTPLKWSDTIHARNSGSKKQSSSKAKKVKVVKNSETHNKSKKETPQKKSSSTKNNLRKVNVLRSENGHLVEDKVISADSPSSNDTGETPFRGASKETRGKSKPRSLSYENEESKNDTVKPKITDWVAPDGTPIPGTSGIIYTKTPGNEKACFQNSMPDKEIPIISKDIQSAEKIKGKRKLNVTKSEKDKVPLKSLKKIDTQKKRVRSRKG